jgi:hypothetical protein
VRITIIIEDGGQTAPTVTVQGTGAGADDAPSGVETSQAQTGRRRAGPALNGGPAPGGASDWAGPTAQDQGIGTSAPAGEQALDAGAPSEPMPMGADRLATSPGATTGQAVDAGAAPPLMGASFAPPPL